MVDNITTVMTRFRVALRLFWLTYWRCRLEFGESLRLAWLALTVSRESMNSTIECAKQTRGDHTSVEAVIRGIFPNEESRSKTGRILIAWIYATLVSSRLSNIVVVVDGLQALIPPLPSENVQTSN